MYKNEHMGITSADVLLEPPTDGGTPKTPNRREKCPQDIQILPKHTNAQGRQQLSVGGAPEGQEPPYRCG